MATPPAPAGPRVAWSVSWRTCQEGSSPRARRSAGDGADQGGPPGFAMAQALTDLQRGSGKSVRALARVINYSPSYVSRLLNGERRPSWEIAEKLILACDGDPEPIRPLWNRVNRGCGGGSSSQHDDLTEAATLMQNALQQMDPAAGPLAGLTREGTDKPPPGRHITSSPGRWPAPCRHGPRADPTRSAPCGTASAPTGRTGFRPLPWAGGNHRPAPRSHRRPRACLEL